MAGSVVRTSRSFSTVRPAVRLFVRVEQRGDAFGGCDAHGVVEEESEPGEGDLVHDVVDVRLKGFLEDLRVDGDELDGHVLVVQHARLDADDFALERHQLPPVLLVERCDLVLVVQQLDVGLGAREFCEGRDDFTEIGQEVATHDTAHATPAVQQVRRLRVVGFGDAVLYLAEQLDQLQRVVAHVLGTNCECDKCGALHSLGAQQAVFLGLLILEHVEQHRHESGVVRRKRSLGRVGDSGNSRQRLLLDEALGTREQLDEFRQEAIQVRLEDVLFGLFAKVDERSGRMRLDAWFWRVEDGDDVGDDDAVVLFLHRARKVCAHLTECVAAGPTHARMRVTQRRNDELEHLVELANHQIAAAF
jgi:hypothetical protein